MWSSWKQTISIFNTSLYFLPINSDYSSLPYHFSPLFQYLSFYSREEIVWKKYIITLPASLKLHDKVWMSSCIPSKRWSTLFSLSYESSLTQRKFYSSRFKLDTDSKPLLGGTGRSDRKWLIKQRCKQW